jgi:hypothetical protein
MCCATLAELMGIGGYCRTRIMDQIYIKIPNPRCCVFFKKHREGVGEELSREKVRGAMFHKACRKFQHD